jgi:Holliday junction resolvasome RuvABC endonuclease subunit
MAEKRVMFWDIATVSGVTFDGPSGGPIPLSATVVARHSDDDHGQAYDVLDRQCTEMIMVHQPDVLAFEAAFPFQGKGASPIPTNFGTVRKILGMVAIVEKCGWRAGIDVYECNIAAIRKHFTGNGRADKAEVLHRCKVLGWPVKNLDEADSAAGWDFTKAMLRSMAVRSA